MAGCGTMVLLLLTAISVMGTSLHEAEPLNGGDLRIGRYQTIAPQPRRDQQDLLSAMVDRELSGNVKTVGEAIEAVLEKSGYRLSPNPTTPCQEKMFELLLPAVHRQLGPMTLRQALEDLSGPAYRPAPDPLSRVVYFEHVLPNEPNAVENYDCD